MLYISVLLRIPLLLVKLDPLTNMAVRYCPEVTPPSAAELREKCELEMFTDAESNSANTPPG